MVVVAAVGPAARKCGGRKRQGGEYFACAHTHDAVSLQGSIRQTIARALLDNEQGYTSSQGRVWTAFSHKYAHAAGAGAYRNRCSARSKFRGLPYGRGMR